MEKIKPEKNIENVIKWWIGGAVLGIFVLILLFMTFYIVNAGERAVLLTFGNPSMNEISEGLHFKIPLAQDVVIMDVKTQKYESESAAASKDLQNVQTKIAINYHLTTSEVPRLYKEIGKDYQNRVMQPVEQEVIKATTAKYTAEELITKREDVRQDMKNLLMEKLNPRGIIVEDVLITNFEFSPSFSQAIEAKVTAEQLKLKAERDLERIKVEKEQKITQAQAEAEALRLQKMQVTPELIALRQIEVQKAFIDKWDGKLPTVMGGALPFFNIETLVSGSRSYTNSTG